MSQRNGRATALVTTAPLFAALGDETRMNIVARLCKAGPSSISELTDGTQVTRQAITKHLHVLAEAGLVLDTKVGRERIFELQPDKLVLVRRAIEDISSRWTEALDRIRQLVES